MVIYLRPNCCNESMTERRNFFFNIFNSDNIRFVAPKQYECFVAGAVFNTSISINNGLATTEGCGCPMTEKVECK